MSRIRNTPKCTRDACNALTPRCMPIERCQRRGPLPSHSVNAGLTAALALDRRNGRADAMMSCRSPCSPSGAADAGTSRTSPRGGQPQYSTRSIFLNFRAKISGKMDLFSLHRSTFEKAPRTLPHTAPVASAREDGGPTRMCALEYEPIIESEKVRRAANSPRGCRPHGGGGEHAFSPRAEPRG